MPAPPGEALVEPLKGPRAVGERVSPFVPVARMSVGLLFEKDAHLLEEFTERRANARNGFAAPKRLEVRRALGEDALELKLGEHERALTVHMGLGVEIARACERVVLALRVATLKRALERPQEHARRGHRKHPQGDEEQRETLFHGKGRGAERRLDECDVERELDGETG